VKASELINQAPDRREIDKVYYNEKIAAWSQDRAKGADNGNDVFITCLFG
jgi:hypothetical protein